METLLRIGLSNAVAAVLLALVVAVVACVWRRPALLHALWLLVLIKLVTPPLLWLPEPWAAPAAPPAVAEKSPDLKPIEFPPDAAPERTGAAAADAAPSLVFDLTAIPAPEPELEAAPSDPEALPTLAAPAPAPALPWWLTTAAGAWLAGAAGWYALAVCRLRRFRRLLRHATPAPESLRQRTQRLAEKMGLRRPPAVWLVPGRLAPMLWAAGGRPRILFPSDLLELVGVEGQNALLVHELAHLRRRDHWVRWLEFAAAGLYWWHPVLWFARRELREAEELCCDAWVTATLPGAGKTYAAALLETLDFLSDSPPAVPVLASGVGRVADLKRRLTMIMRGTTPKALGWRGLLAVLGTGLLMLPLLPAWARAQVAAPPLGVAPPPMPTPAAAAPAADQDNARAALQAAEAELEQKQAEVAVLSAKVQQLRARLKAEQTAAPAATPPGSEVAARLEGGRFVVRVDPAADPKAVEDGIKGLRQSRPVGADLVVIDAKSGRIIMKVEGTPPAVGKDQLIMVPIGAVGGTAGPAGGTGGAPAAESDKRIDDLEQRLKSILDEVEKLRRERKDAAPGKGGGTPPPGGAAPALDKVPHLDRLFTNTNASAQEQLKALAAQFQAEEAWRADLAAKLENLKVKAADLTKLGDAEAADARARESEAQRLVNATEAQLAKARVKDPKSDEVRGTAAELDVYREQLDKARAVWEKKAADEEQNLQLVLLATTVCERELKASVMKLRQLQEEMSKLKNAPAGANDPADPRAKPAPKDPDEASAAFSTADYYFNAGNYETALKLSDEIAARHPKEEVGVTALGQSVRCLMAMGRKEEVSRRLQEIKGRLDVLPSDAKAVWEKWLEVAAPAVAR